MICLTEIEEHNLFEIENHLFLSLLSNIIRPGADCLCSVSEEITILTEAV